MRERLLGVIPEFIIILVSAPVNTTAPITQSVFFKLHPLNNKFSILMASALISGSTSVGAEGSLTYHLATPLYEYRFGPGPSLSIQKLAASQS
jgi:hypothetical protein